MNLYRITYQRPGSVWHSRMTLAARPREVLPLAASLLRGAYLLRISEIRSLNLGLELT